MTSCLLVMLGLLMTPTGEDGLGNNLALKLVRGKAVGYAHGPKNGQVSKFTFFDNVGKVVHDGELPRGIYAIKMSLDGTMIGTLTFVKSESTKSNHASRFSLYNKGSLAGSWSLNGICALAPLNSGFVVMGEHDSTRVFERRGRLIGQVLESKTSFMDACAYNNGWLATVSASDRMSLVKVSNDFSVVGPVVGAPEMANRCAVRGDRGSVLVAEGLSKLWLSSKNLVHFQLVAENVEGGFGWIPISEGWFFVGNGHNLVVENTVKRRSINVYSVEVHDAVALGSGAFAVLYCQRGQRDQGLALGILVDGSSRPTSVGEKWHGFRGIARMR